MTILVGYAPTNTKENTQRGIAFYEQVLQEMVTIRRMFGNFIIFARDFNARVGVAEIGTTAPSVLKGTIERTVEGSMGYRK